MSEIVHRGVSPDDPLNRGIIARFRPPTPTLAQLARIDAGQLRASPPLSQPLEAAPDPWWGLSTHPDLVEQLWRLDRSLPRSCRWLLWGYPALVRPETGVVFALAFGTVGIVVRLPPGFRESASAFRPTNPGQVWDISPAGPEWRFLPRGNEEPACAAAYAFATASLTAPPRPGSL
ncbi:MAG TPA: hypothetical protein VG166_07860 [Caulobacteraceae bacterium]|nr:hypothetical protein [Caulobacteraceae bacterium]